MLKEFARVLSDPDSDTSPNPDFKGPGHEEPEEGQGHEESEEKLTKEELDRIRNTETVTKDEKKDVEQKPVEDVILDELDYERQKSEQLVNTLIRERNILLIGNKNPETFERTKEYLKDRGYTETEIAEFMRLASIELIDTEIVDTEALSLQDKLQKSERLRDMLEEINLEAEKQAEALNLAEENVVVNKQSEAFKEKHGESLTKEQRNEVARAFRQAKLDGEISSDFLEDHKNCLANGGNSSDCSVEAIAGVIGKQSIKIAAVVSGWGSLGYIATTINTLDGIGAPRPKSNTKFEVNIKMKHGSRRSIKTPSGQTWRRAAGERLERVTDDSTIHSFTGTTAEFNKWYESNLDVGLEDKNLYEEINRRMKSLENSRNAAGLEESFRGSAHLSNLRGVKKNEIESVTIILDSANNIPLPVPEPSLIETTEGYTYSGTTELSGIPSSIAKHAKSQLAWVLGIDEKNITPERIIYDGILTNEQMEQIKHYKGLAATDKLKPSDLGLTDISPTGRFIKSQMKHFSDVVVNSFNDLYNWIDGISSGNLSYFVDGAKLIINKAVNAAKSIFTQIGKAKDMIIQFIPTLVGFAAGGLAGVAVGTVTAVPAVLGGIVSLAFYGLGRILPSQQSALFGYSDYIWKNIVTGSFSAIDSSFRSVFEMAKGATDSIQKWMGTKAGIYLGKIGGTALGVITASYDMAKGVANTISRVIMEFQNYLVTSVIFSKINAGVNKYANNLAGKISNKQGFTGTFLGKLATSIFQNVDKQAVATKLGQMSGLTGTLDEMKKTAGEELKGKLVGRLFGNEFRDFIDEIYKPDGYFTSAKKMGLQGLESFGSFISYVNPLQYIPGVNTVTSAVSSGASSVIEGVQGATDAMSGAIFGRTSITNLIDKLTADLVGKDPSSEEFQKASATITDFIEVLDGISKGNGLTDSLERLIDKGHIDLVSDLVWGETPLLNTVTGAIIDKNSKKAMRKIYSMVKSKIAKRKKDGKIISLIGTTTVDNFFDEGEILDSDFIFFQDNRKGIDEMKIKIKKFLEGDEPYKTGLFDDGKLKPIYIDFLKENLNLTQEQRDKLNSGKLDSDILQKLSEIEDKDNPNFKDFLEKITNGINYIIKKSGNPIKDRLSKTLSVWNDSNIPGRLSFINHVKNIYEVSKFNNEIADSIDKILRDNKLQPIRVPDNDKKFQFFKKDSDETTDKPTDETTPGSYKEAFAHLRVKYKAERALFDTSKAGILAVSTVAELFLSTVNTIITAGWGLVSLLKNIVTGAVGLFKKIYNLEWSSIGTAVSDFATDIGKKFADEFGIEIDVGAGGIAIISALAFVPGMIGVGAAAGIGYILGKRIFYPLFKNFVKFADSALLAVRSSLDSVNELSQLKRNYGNFWEKLAAYVWEMPAGIFSRIGIAVYDIVRPIITDFMQYLGVETYEPDEIDFEFGKNVAYDTIYTEYYDFKPIPNFGNLRSSLDADTIQKYLDYNYVPIGDGIWIRYHNSSEDKESDEYKNSLYNKKTGKNNFELIVENDPFGILREKVESELLAGELEFMERTEIINKALAQRTGLIDLDKPSKKADGSYAFMTSGMPTDTMGTQPQKKFKEDIYELFFKKPETPEDMKIRETIISDLDKIDFFKNFKSVTTRNRNGDVITLGYTYEAMQSYKYELINPNLANEMKEMLKNIKLNKTYFLLPNYSNFYVFDSDNPVSYDEASDKLRFNLADRHQEKGKKPTFNKITVEFSPSSAGITDLNIPDGKVVPWRNVYSHVKHILYGNDGKPFEFSATKNDEDGDDYDKTKRKHTPLPNPFDLVPDFFNLDPHNIKKSMKAYNSGQTTGQQQSVFSTHQQIKQKQTSTTTTGQTSTTTKGQTSTTTTTTTGGATVNDKPTEITTEDKDDKPTETITEDKDAISTEITTEDKVTITEENSFKNQIIFMNEFIYNGYKWKKIINNEKTEYHLLDYDNNPDTQYKDRIYYKTFDISYTRTYNPSSFFYMLDTFYEYKMDIINRYREYYAKYDDKQLVSYKYNNHNDIINDMVNKITNIN